MQRPWPVHALMVLCLLLAPVRGNSQPSPPIVAAAVVDAYLPNDSSIPPEMVDLMRNAQLRYREGSNLIKLGESDKARAAFDSAVELLLKSQWDVRSTTPINNFFQDLIQRIQHDESRYLRPPGNEEGRPEGAVVDELDDIDLIPITIDPSLQDVVEKDLANTKYDIPITLNERVLKSLNYWLNRGRKLFVDGLMRSGRYHDMISRIFREEAIPKDIMYLAQVESLFKTNAFSRAQARGIWQFGKWTAIRYGLKVNGYVDERSDPEKSTRAAARYLTDLFAMFNDWNLVLAAYNCGEAKIQKLIEKSGLSDFWELADLKRKLPEETKNHVPLIMASIILARNPDKYGLPQELDQPLTYDSLAVSKPIDLRSVAKILDISLEDLKRLNPALRGLSTPAGYPEYQLKIPAGTDPELGKKIAALPAAGFKPESDFAGRHRVKSGETLWGIANLYRLPVATLQTVNGIGAPKSLRVGSWIQVPSPRSLVSGRVAKRISTRTPSKPIKSSVRSMHTQKRQGARAGPARPNRAEAKGGLVRQSRGGPTGRTATAPAVKSARPILTAQKKIHSEYIAAE